MNRYGQGACIFLLMFLLILISAGCEPGRSQPYNPGSSPTAGQMGSPSETPEESVTDGPEETPAQTAMASPAPMPKGIKGKFTEEDFGLSFYPGALRVEEFKTDAGYLGKGTVQKAAVFLTDANREDVFKFYMGQFEDPTVIDDGEGNLTITFKARDLWVSDVITMVTVGKSDVPGQTEIVLFSQK